MNHGYSYSYIVQQSGMLLDILSAHFRHSSYSEWQERLLKGQIQRDGVTLRENKMVLRGQKIIWHRPPWQEPPVPRCTEILYEDKDFVAVNKPSGLPTMPAGGFLEHTLLMQLREHWSSVTPIHRLGRGTSGIVLCALTPQAKKMAHTWSSVQKYYLALASGSAQQEHYSIHCPIGLVEHPLLGQLYAASSLGKSAHSEATVLQRGVNTLFGVQILTGRPHQIRIHLASIGHPLWGDPLYTATGFLPQALPSDLGYWLHAHRICFIHPVTQKMQEIIAPVPSFPKSFSL